MIQPTPNFIVKVSVARNGYIVSEYSPQAGPLCLDEYVFNGFDQLCDGLRRLLAVPAENVPPQPSDSR